MADFYGNKAIAAKIKAGNAKILMLGDSILQGAMNDNSINIIRRVWRPDAWGGGGCQVLQGSGGLVGVYAGSIAGFGTRTQTYYIAGSAIENDVYGDPGSWSLLGTNGITFNGGNTDIAARFLELHIGTVTAGIQDREFASGHAALKAQHTLTFKALLRHHPSAAGNRIVLQITNAALGVLATSDPISLDDVEAAETQVHSLSATVPAGNVGLAKITFEDAQATVNLEALETGWGHVSVGSGLEITTAAWAGYDAADYVNVARHPATSWELVEQLGIDTLLIWLGANAAGTVEEYQTLFDRCKVYNPDLQLVLVPTYQIGADPWTSPRADLATNRDNMIQVASDNGDAACVINLYDAAAHIRLLEYKYIADHVHPTGAGTTYQGYQYFLSRIWEIIEQAAAAENQYTTDQAAVTAKAAYVYPNAALLEKNDGTLRASNIGTLAGTDNLAAADLRSTKTVDNVAGSLDPTSDNPPTGTRFDPAKPYG